MEKDNGQKTPKAKGMNALPAFAANASDACMWLLVGAALSYACRSTQVRSFFLAQVKAAPALWIFVGVPAALFLGSSLRWGFRVFRWRLFGGIVAVAAPAIFILVGASQPQQVLAVALAIVAATIIATALIWREEHAATARPATDAPVTDQREDLLARGPLVDGICAQVENPKVRCPRIALTGQVGSGKTTVVNFIATRLEANGNRVFRFDPWHHGGDRIGTAFVEALDRELRQLAGFPDHGMFRRMVAAAGAKWTWTKPLLEPFDDALSSARKELGRLIAGALGGKRLVILIEDLERCPHSAVPELLMRMHELVDAEGLAYLFAFDRKRVEAMLSEKEVSVKEEILAKTFDMLVPLAEPRLGQREAIWRRAAADLGLPEWMAEGWPIQQAAMPKTPRDVKRLAVFVSAFSSRLQGFSDAWARKFAFGVSLLDFHLHGFVREAFAGGILLRTLATHSLAKALDKKPDPNRPAFSVRLLKAEWANAPEYVENVFELVCNIVTESVFGGDEWIGDVVSTLAGEAVDGSRQVRDAVLARMRSGAGTEALGNTIAAGGLWDQLSTEKKVRLLWSVAKHAEYGAWTSALAAEESHYREWLGEAAHRAASVWAASPSHVPVHLVASVAVWSRFRGFESGFRLWVGLMRRTTSDWALALSAVNGVVHHFHFDEQCEGKTMPWVNDQISALRRVALSRLVRAYGELLICSDDDSVDANPTLQQDLDRIGEAVFKNLSETNARSWLRVLEKWRSAAPDKKRLANACFTVASRACSAVSDGQSPTKRAAQFALDFISELESMPLSGTFRRRMGEMRKALA